MESLQLMLAKKIADVCLNLIKVERISRANKSRKFLHRVWSLCYRFIASISTKPSSKLQSRCCVKFGRQKLFLFIQSYKYHIRHQLHLHTMIFNRKQNLWRHCLAKSMLTSSLWSMTSFFSAVVGLVMVRLTFIDKNWMILLDVVQIYWHEVYW